jgi:type I restriction enzyme, S subunit
MKNIPKSRLLSLELVAPAYDEQVRIAEALEATDELITRLELLIAKKESIKQGMMQQLLTGKTRLPGYSASWVSVTAGHVGAFKGGSGFPIKYQGLRAGEYPFFKVSDMNNEGNELFMTFARHYVGESQRKQMGAVVMPKDAIVFAKVGGAIFLERKRILSQSSCIDNNMAAFTLDPMQADVRFVHYAFTNFAMASLVATTALPSLNGGQLRSIPLVLPKELREQRAIAAVLGDADAELSALAARLAKTKTIKQGMMQELLTGRTRIPAESVS